MKAIARLFQYFDVKDIKPTRFEKDFEFSNGYFGTQLRRNADLGEGVLNKIIDNSLDLNAEWLLTGRGEMLKKDNIKDVHPISISRKTKDIIRDTQDVPLYDLEATAGLSALFKDGSRNAIIDSIRIPDIAGCDGAVYVKGDSMYPLLKSGDIILYKQIDLDNIFWGEMYLLSVILDETADYISVKFVQRSELGDDYIKLVSQNQHHQSRDIKKTQITAIALVRASIRTHN